MMEPAIAQYLCMYIYKMDADTGCGLRGVRYTLCAPDGKKQSAVTDCSGRARFHALPCMAYTLAETEIPAGHSCPLSAVTHTIRVECDGQLYLDGMPVHCVRL